MDLAIRAAAAVTVLALAAIAAAISYSHMRMLAESHGESGWRAHAFPLSVDGIEIVASLVLLADRRAGRRSGLLPWAALIAGVAASLAANVAVAGHDAIGRAVAGWPALTLLIAVKLLSGLLDGADRPPVAKPDQPSADERPAAATRTQSDRSVCGPAGRPAAPARTRSDRRTADLDVSALLPAARTAGAELTADGRGLTRAGLAQRMRAAGHAVSNDRASVLVKILKSERAATGNAAQPTMRSNVQ